MTRPSRRDALAALALAASARTARAGDPAGEIRRIIDRAVASGRIPGAVVIVRKDGRNVVEEAAGYAVIEQRRPMRADDLFMIASSTKPFTATAVLTLADQGKLGLDDPVRRYYPAFQGSSTIRQLLSHTSGVFGNDAPPEVGEAMRDFDRTRGASVELSVREPLAYQPAPVLLRRRLVLRRRRHRGEGLRPRARRAVAVRRARTAWRHRGLLPLRHGSVRARAADL